VDEDGGVGVPYVRRRVDVEDRRGAVVDAVPFAGLRFGGGSGRRIGALVGRLHGRLSGGGRRLGSRAARRRSAAAGALTAVLIVVQRGRLLIPVIAIHSRFLRAAGRSVTCTCGLWLPAGPSCAARRRR